MIIHQRSLRPRRTIVERTTDIAVLLLMALMLLVVMPAMAHVASPLDGEPGPLPAPAPAALTR